MHLRYAFFRMYFAENSAFGKILKLFLRSDSAESNVFGWYFIEYILLIKKYIIKIQYVINCDLWVCWVAECFFFFFFYVCFCEFSMIFHL